MKAIKFSASWCGPCKMLSKKLEQEGIKIEERDVDQNKDDAKLYGIRGVPTIIILDNDGNKLDAYVGANLSNEQLEKLKELSL